MTYEYHFGVEVYVKKPESIWARLLGALSGADEKITFVLVYELDGPSHIEALKGDAVVLVKGPHDRV